MARIWTGKPLTILDSGMERIDSHTIQGFQEVKLPDGFEPTDVLSIDLIVSYNMHVWAQDGQNIYHTILRTPENRGFFRLPFSVKLNGQTETYTGSIQTRAYNAQATIRMSDVDLSGEVVFDAPEWAMAFEADSDGKHLMNMPDIHNYTLIADGVELPNLDGGFGVNRDGQFFIQIRYDLPESLNSLTLVPTGTGLGESATAERENEEIILFQSLPLYKENTMKKMIFWLCALMLVPALAIADGDGVSISELKAQTPNYLEGSYEAHGRHISFHAPHLHTGCRSFSHFASEKNPSIRKSRRKNEGASGEKHTLWAENPRSFRRHIARKCLYLFYSLLSKLMGA